MSGWASTTNRFDARNNSQSHPGSRSAARQYSRRQPVSASARIQQIHGSMSKIHAMEREIFSLQPTMLQASPTLRGSHKPPLCCLPANRSKLKGLGKCTSSLMTAMLDTNHLLRVPPSLPIICIDLGCLLDISDPQAPRRASGCAGHRQVFPDQPDDRLSASQLLVAATWSTRTPGLSLSEPRSRTYGL